MAKNSNKQYALALYEVIKKVKGNELNKILYAFAEKLAKDHKLKQAERIIAEFIRHAKAEEGIKEIEIITAQEVDQKIIDKIKKIFGEKVEATVKVDEGLIGGVKVKTGDKILDGSVKTQLTNLKNNII